MVSFSGERRLKAIPSSKVTSDKTLLSENSLLRDQVEKERFRRKVCVASLISFAALFGGVRSIAWHAKMAAKEAKVCVDQLCNSHYLINTSSNRHCDKN